MITIDNISKPLSTIHIGTVDITDLCVYLERRYPNIHYLVRDSGYTHLYSFFDFNLPRLFKYLSNQDKVEHYIRFLEDLVDIGITLQDAEYLIDIFKQKFHDILAIPVNNTDNYRAKLHTDRVILEMDILYQCTNNRIPKWSENHNAYIRRGNYQSTAA